MSVCNVCSCLIGNKDGNIRFFLNTVTAIFLSPGHLLLRAKHGDLLSSLWRGAYELITAESMVWAWQGTASSAAFTEQTGASNPFNGTPAMHACLKMFINGDRGMCWLLVMMTTVHRS